MADTTEATIVVTATANKALVTPQSFARVRVHACCLLIGGTVTTNSLISTVTTALQLTLPLTAGLIVLPYNPAGWFDTILGEGLSISLAGTSPTLNGSITYSQV